MNFNFDPLSVDLTKPGEAFLKSMTLLSVGTVFEGVDINQMHLPPIIVEVAKTLAYLGASVAFFKFLINLFRPSKKDDSGSEKSTSVKEDE
jgi:hypothetical protein